MCFPQREAQNDTMRSVDKLLQELILFTINLHVFIYTINVYLFNFTRIL